MVDPKDVAGIIESTEQPPASPELTVIKTDDLAFDAALLDG